MSNYNYDAQIIGGDIIDYIMTLVYCPYCHTRKTCYGLPGLYRNAWPTLPAIDSCA